MTTTTTTTATTGVGASTGVPEPDKVLSYNDNSALFLYGDPSSSKMALLSAGFADDHTVFQPFAKALSEQGGMFVGVICLPGFDDRPEAPWESHKPDGYTWDEWVQSIREAAKLLRKTSTCNEKAEFTGIFHDFGVVAGAMWASRLEEEATDATDPTRPDKIVFFDVLLGPSLKTKDIPEGDKLTRKQMITMTVYRVILAAAFLLQRYVSRLLAPVAIIPAFVLMAVSGLSPCYDWDTKSTEPLYGDNKPGIQRVLYMSYPYWNMLKTFASSNKQKTFSHHSDWKALPILYLYGPKKPTVFHEMSTLKMLEIEEAEGRSLSKAVAVEDTGHFLYVQKQDECLKHVLDFVRAENTFAP